MKTHKNKPKQPSGGRPKFGDLGKNNAGKNFNGLLGLPFFDFFKSFFPAKNARLVAFLFLIFVSVLFYQCGSSGECNLNEKRTGLNFPQCSEDSSSTGGNIGDGTGGNIGDGDGNTGDGTGDGNTGDSTGDGNTGDGTGDGTKIVTKFVTPATFKAIWGDKENTLSWNKVPGAISYTLYWSTVKGKGTAGNKISGITGIEYVHRGLTDGTTYYYTLVAVMPKDYVYTAPSDTGLNTPANFKAIPENQINKLSWDKLPAAESYTLSWSTKEGQSIAGTPIPGITGTEYVHRDLTNDTPYYYTLTAVSANGINLSPAGEISSTPKCGYSGTSAGDGGYKLPHTGQIKKLTKICGEDSDYVLNAKSYTDNGNATVTDNNTGLIWEKLPNRADRKSMSQPEAVTACRARTTAGHTDWRLPTVKELVGIADLNKEGPALDTAFFPNSSPSNYWTSSLFSSDPETGWFISFDIGEVKEGYKTAGFYVRCVRSPKPQPDTKFTDNSDDTVSDSKTGLMWQKLPKPEDHAAKKWDAAVNQCEALNFAGYTDWRLPNIFELVSIADYARIKPAIDTTFFPNTANKRYWASTLHPSYPEDSAWYTLITYGVTETNSKINNYFVRCVRTINSSNSSSSLEIFATPKSASKKVEYRVTNNSGKNVDFYIDDPANPKYNNGCNGTKLFSIKAGATASKETNLCGKVISSCYQAADLIQYSVEEGYVSCGDPANRTLKTTDAPSSAVLSLTPKGDDVEKVFVYKRDTMLKIEHDNIMKDAGLNAVLAKDKTTLISTRKCHPTDQYTILAQYKNLRFQPIAGFFNSSKTAKPWATIACGETLSYEFLKEQ